MDTEMRKRLEEAAEKYASKVWTNPMFLQEWSECKWDFIAGAEYGYKEAITQVRLYLENRLEYKIKIHQKNIERNVVNEESICLFDFLDDLESDMNKLWEEKK